MIVGSMASVLPLHREPRTPKSRRSMLKVVSNPAKSPIPGITRTPIVLRYRDPLRYATDGQVIFDIIGILSSGTYLRAAKGKCGVFLDVKEVVGTQHFVAARSRPVEAAGLHGHLALAFRRIFGAIGQRPGEILKQSFFFEDHPFCRCEGERRIGLAHGVNFSDFGAAG